MDITIHLPKATTASLTLLNLHQHPVRHIITEQPLSQGTHTISVQIADLPSGLYLIQLRTPETTIHARLIKQ